MTYIFFALLVALVRAQNTTTTANDTTTASPATNATTVATTAMNANATTMMTTMASMSNTTATTIASNATNAADGACSVVRFSLLTTFGSSESLVLKNAPCNLTLTLKPNGGALRCRTEFGCGIGPQVLLANQTTQNGTRRDDNFELNGNESISLSFSRTALLWRALVGQFDAGVDTFVFNITNAFAAPTSNRTSVSVVVGVPEWTALSTIINDGIELPPTIAVDLAPDPLAAVTLRWIEVKPYTAPVITDAPATLTVDNSTTTTASTESLPFIQDAMKNHPLYFWLVVAAVVVVVLALVGVVICCCCLRRDEDETNEGYSMRDMNYTDPDYL